MPRRLYMLLEARQRLGFAGVLAAILAMAMIEVVGVGSIFWFITLINDPSPIHTNRWLAQAYAYLGSTSDLRFLFALGAAVLAVVVLRNIIGAVVVWVRVSFVKYTEAAIGRRLLGSYVSRAYEYFLTKNTAELSKNILQEVRQLTSGLMMPLIIIATDATVALAILGILLWQDFAVAGTALLVVTLTLGGVYGAVRRKLGHLGHKQRAANEAAFKAAGEALQGIKVSKTFGRERYFVDAYAGTARRLARIGVASALYNQIPRYGVEAIAFGGLVAIILYTLATTGQSSDAIGALALYGAAGYRIMPSLFRILQSAGQIRFSRAIFDAVSGELEQSRFTATEAGGPVVPLPFEHEIELDDVAFRYAGTERWVLDGIKVSVPRRGAVGFVGATGAGKSTLVDVIMGLLEPTRGRLVVDGTQIGSQNVAAWRADVGYVPQDIYLLDDTIARNIAFGLPDDVADAGAVERAATMAHIHDFVTGELADGYDTVIGERGVRLSGGQRQRIGIARALYHQPRLLVLDEATSSLDGITEAVIAEAIAELSSAMTMVIIAHRINTVRNCDVIHMMDEGGIIDSGTYDQLFENSDLFRRMVHMPKSQRVSGVA